MKRHYIYRIEEQCTGEFYWGVRSCICTPIDDPYMGSMITWRPNKCNLIKTDIIEYPNRSEADKAEMIKIDYYCDKDKFPLNRNYHNGKSFRCRNMPITCETREKYIHAANNRSVSHVLNLKKAAAKRTSYAKMTQETKDKISKSLVGRRRTNEEKLNISIGKKGKCKSMPQSLEEKQKRVSTRKNNGMPWMPIEHYEKLSILFTGKLVSEQTRVKISAAQKGKAKPPRTSEHQRKLTESQIGRKSTDEAKANISKALTGRTLSQEHKDAISRGHARRNKLS